jgi:hypothetical protein
VGPGPSQRDPGSGRGRLARASTLRRLQRRAWPADLVTAFNDSLKDDNDLAPCLNEANDGTEAIIFEDCPTASSGDNTATADKQTLLDTYNQLGASVGHAADQRTLLTTVARGTVAGKPGRTLSR